MNLIVVDKIESYENLEIFKNDQELVLNRYTFENIIRKDGNKVFAKIIGCSFERTGFDEIINNIQKIKDALSILIDIVAEDRPNLNLDNYKKLL